MNINLSKQEKSIYNYLKDKNNQEIVWEELKQFTKDPTSVKKGTIQKTVSEIKRKFKLAELSFPFEIKFVDKLPAVLLPHKNESKEEEIIPKQQLVKVRKTIGGRTVAESDTRPDAQIDFPPDPNKYVRRVITRNGAINLNEPEWEVYKYFYENTGKKISIIDLRDKVTFYKKPFGQLPANWRESIQRIVQNLRKQLGLNGRLITIPSVPGQETMYMFE